MEIMQNGGPIDNNSQKEYADGQNEKFDTFCTQSGVLITIDYSAITLQGCAIDHVVHHFDKVTNTNYTICWCVISLTDGTVLPIGQIPKHRIVFFRPWV